MAITSIHRLYELEELEWGGIQAGTVEVQVPGRVWPEHLQIQEISNVVATGEPMMRDMGRGKSLNLTPVGVAKLLVHYYELEETHQEDDSGWAYIDPGLKTLNEWYKLFLNWSEIVRAAGVEEFQRMYPQLPALYAVAIDLLIRTSAIAHKAPSVEAAPVLAIRVELLETEALGALDNLRIAAEEWKL